ncbi:MAG: hypothetical protein IJ075_03205 [Lachnospiraceae bacterium]|nr:hypothetical protein [Lachnospiraceae bacterium]MBQ9606873.1 hypothetical protein [Lachnospiraceae bacterium]MBR1523114.1 hypothetical protein [Lachnospiraceae bacterium]
MIDQTYEGENYAELLTVKYAADIQKLSRYISYFENKKGSDVASDYSGEQGESQLKFPVFDSTLLAFTKEAADTALMDPNYMYKYRQYHISTEPAEKAAIKDAKLRDIDLLRAILSRYVLEGRYKSRRWIEGAERGVYYDVLVKFVELYEFVKTDHQLNQ